MNYFKHYGGPNPEYATDIASYGSYLFITGYSLSSGLSPGGYSIFLISCLRDGSLRFVKYIGSSTSDESP